MICNSCNAQIEDNATFCPVCGAAVAPQNNATPYPQQNYNPGYNPAAPVPGKGFAIAALVMGILSFFIVPLLFGGLGIVFGALAKNKGYRGGMATAGIVCGIIGIALWIIMIAFIESAKTAVYNSLF